MSNFLLFLLAASSMYLPYTPVDVLSITGKEDVRTFCKIPPIGYAQYATLEEIEAMLRQKSAHLSAPVIDKVLRTFKCAAENRLPYNNVLTIIDYSLASNQKRLWVFDLQDKRLLFYTYVSHGIKSGALFTNYFSNKYNSKATSFGVYKTAKSYYGREGLSLRLDGIDRGFNDNASSRAIVMHGGWYAEEAFIKKYGRPGRSWGCPALPLELYQPIINTIKDSSLMVAYYPEDNWFKTSKFLNCQGNTSSQAVNKTQFIPPIGYDFREEVLLTGVDRKFKSESNEAILVMKASHYKEIFHNTPPLERMLRRQIDKIEYIALSNAEFFQMFINKNPELKMDDKDALNSVYFVTPVIEMNRGYYETHMNIINLGAIKDVRLNADSTKKMGGTNSYTVFFEGKPAINLRPTDRFIRWLGL